MLYEPRVSDARARGLLYVGVIATHTKKQYLVRVPSQRASLLHDKQLSA